MTAMQDDVLVVADHHSWVKSWRGPVMAFEDLTFEALDSYRTVVLAPGDTKYQEDCRRIFDWKRQGLLAGTRLVLGTYKGRHLWSPENDAVVDRWVVHARSERQVLDSDKLAFAPVCLMPPRTPYPQGDDGYLFMGGRKWRVLDVGLAAMSRSGHPGRVITDLAPEGDFPGVQIQREKIPKADYSAVMARARLILVPLKLTPVSHGHVDVVTAILLGKPVLVTAGCSCDDYVQHGVNGLLVPDNSVEAWEAAIHEAWDRAEEFAAAARAMAPDYVPARYADYLREIAGFPEGGTV
jgi:glycosyltransferase involved in cell wall biosynthesis